MNKLAIAIFTVMLFTLIPIVASAQPAPPNYVKYCYTVLFPIPHTHCEYRYVYYTPAYIPPPRYTPAPRYRQAPPPPGPRPGHHPPPPRHHR